MTRTGSRDLSGSKQPASFTRKRSATSRQTAASGQTATRIQTSDAQPLAFTSPERPKLDAAQVSRRLQRTGEGEFTQNRVWNQAQEAENRNRDERIEQLSLRLQELEDRMARLAATSQVQTPEAAELERRMNLEARLARHLRWPRRWRR